MLDNRFLKEPYRRGGQEHDIYELDDRVLKVTRVGMFGFCPGIDIDLVEPGVDGRKFHLYEATPVQYLLRLELQNLLVPGLNSLEGIVEHAEGGIGIVISQPRFEILAVSEERIDAWFADQGFHKVTDSGYYREEDNVAVFDAHAKNVVAFGRGLMPFDVIPCHPGSGFAEFIRLALARQEKLRAVRRVSPPLSD